MTETTLDVRPIPAAEKHPRIFERFDALAEGDSFVLVNDHDPRPLYYQFRMERPGVFLWIPLTDGPEEWRIEIVRVKPKETETEVGSYFGRDHDEIDAILGYLRKDLRVGDPHRTAARLFDEFDARLERHIRWEEEILFPAVERGESFLAEGPGRVMRLEHEEIRRLKAIAAKHLHEESPTADGVARAAEAIEGMTSVLVAHNHKEESIYYPTADQLFGGEEAGEILARVRALR